MISFGSMSRLTMATKRLFNYLARRVFSQSGSQQGDTLGTVLFANSLQPLHHNANSKLLVLAYGGIAVSPRPCFAHHGLILCFALGI